MIISDRSLNFIKKYHYIVAFLFFTFVALFFTYPLIVKFGSEIPTGTSGDIYQVVASIEGRAEVLKEQGIMQGLWTLAKRGEITTFAPHSILSQFFNFAAAYNIMFLLSFILSGWGTYILAFYVTKSKKAALLAGLIFAFNPFHFYQLIAAHAGTMQQEWIPFFVYFILKFFEKLNLKYYLLSALFAFLIALADPQLLAFTAIFILFLAIYKLFSDKKLKSNRKFWIYAGTSFAMLAFFVVFLFGNFLKVASSENNYLDTGIGSAKKYSMATLDPLAPPLFHSLWPKASTFIQGIILGSEKERGSYFIGYVVLAVIVNLFYHIYYLPWKKKKNIGPEDKIQFKEVTFWTLGTALFYVFALGPAFNIGKTSIYLPYFLIYKFVPFYENIRTTGRFFVYATLGFSILFAFGFVYLMKKYDGKKIFLTVACAILIMLEYWTMPLSTFSISYSEYYSRIAEDSGNYKILEIPGSTNYRFASFSMITNNIHKKQPINGMALARTIKDQFAFQQTTPVIKQLLYTLPKGNIPKENLNDTIKETYYSKATDIMNYYQIRYVTISKEFTEEKSLKNSEAFIERYIRYDDKYEDAYLVAYEISKTEPSGFYAKLETKDKKWTEIKKDNTRRIGSGASLSIFNLEKNELPLSVSVRLNNSSGKKIAFSINDERLEESSVSAESGKINFNLNARPGKNEVKILAYDASGKEIPLEEKSAENLSVSDISIMSMR